MNDNNSFYYWDKMSYNSYTLLSKYLWTIKRSPLDPRLQNYKCYFICIKCIDLELKRGNIISNFGYSKCASKVCRKEIDKLNEWIQRIIVFDDFNAIPDFKWNSLKFEYTYCIDGFYAYESGTPDFWICRQHYLSADQLNSFIPTLIATELLDIILSYVNPRKASRMSPFVCI